MTCTPSNLTFEAWIKEATQNLPAVARQRLREEMTAHFHDALAAYRDSGQTAFEAERAALQELGDPQLTAAQLSRIYMSQRNYHKAIAVSQLFTVLVLVRTSLQHLAWAQPIIAVSGFLLLVTQPICLWYLLHTLQRHVQQRYRLRQPMLIITLSTLTLVLTLILSGIFEDIWLPNALTILLSISVLAAMMGLCFGLLRLGWELGKMQALGRISLPVCAMLITGAVILFSVLLLAVFNLNHRQYTWLVPLVDVLGALGILVYTILCACFSWIFIHAVYQPAPTMRFHKESL